MYGRGPILAAFVMILAVAVAQTAPVFATEEPDVYYACATPKGRVLAITIRLNEKPKCIGKLAVVSWQSGGSAGAVELPSDCEDGDVLVVQDGELACKSQIVLVDGNGLEIPVQILTRLDGYAIEGVTPQGYLFEIIRNSGVVSGPDLEGSNYGTIITNHAYLDPACVGPLYTDEAAPGSTKIGYDADDYAPDVGVPLDKWYIPLDAPTGEGLTGASFGYVKGTFDAGVYTEEWKCELASIPLGSTFFRASPDDPEVTGVPDAYPAPVSYKVP